MQRLNHLLVIGGEQADRLAYARKIAFAVLCLNRTGMTPCNNCPNCIRANANTHPNLSFITPNSSDDEELSNDHSNAENYSGTIKIEQIRRVILEQQKANFERGKNVFVITHIHRITKASGNALLKSIEESNPDKLFLALAPSRMAVLPTIASRLVCHRVKPSIKTLAFDEDMVKRLKSLSRIKPLARFSLISTFKTERDELLKEIDQLTLTCHHLFREQQIFTPSAVLSLLEAFDKALRRLQKNQNPRLVLEALIFHDWPLIEEQEPNE